MRNALSVACELYDELDEDGELRDLLDHEIKLIAAVNLARTRRAEFVGEVIRTFGDGTEAYVHAVKIAEERMQAEFTRILEDYDRAMDALDEVEEIEMAEAAE